MSSQKTIERLRTENNKLQDRITSLTLENMYLKDDAKKYQERYEGIRDILKTPGLDLHICIAEQIVDSKTAKSQDFEKVVKKLKI
jgi:predicted nuclease with TOPRIM domain